eukprot:1204859-Pyramimonas_sp.AAC.1
MALRRYHSHNFTCHRPGRDFVIPDMDFTPTHLDFDHAEAGNGLPFSKYLEENGTPGLALGVRTSHTLFFAGEINVDNPTAKMWNKCGNLITRMPNISELINCRRVSGVLSAPLPLLAQEDP